MDIYSIFKNVLGYYIEINDDSKKNEILKMFIPLLEENQDFISSYFKNTVELMDQPDYFVCLESIKQKFDRIIFNQLLPDVSLNFKLKTLAKDIKNNEKDFKEYNNFVNIKEIISSIMKTKYHSDKELNSLFQIKAINYIINDNSYFCNFIYKLYLALLDHF